MHMTRCELLPVLHDTQPNVTFQLLSLPLRVSEDLGQKSRHNDEIS
jgi:hypothetical protein